MSLAIRKPCDAWAALLVSAVVLFAQSPDPAADLVQEGRKLASTRKFDDALAIYRKALAASPNSLEGNLAAGAALDLKAQYAEARKYFAKAIEVASPETRGEALRSMAISYAFESNSTEAAKYEKPLFDSQLAAKKFREAGETAMEWARICLESSDLDCAAKWYQTGYDTGLREPNLSDATKDLWTFRYESGKARLAARRGKADVAKLYVAAAKEALDKGSNPDQASILPFVAGYVAFYAGDYQTAYAEFQKADLHDAFVLAMIAETYGKMEDKAGQTEYYRQVLTIHTHNASTAFGRPLALLPPPE